MCDAIKLQKMWDNESVRKVKHDDCMKEENEPKVLSKFEQVKFIRVVDPRTVLKEFKLPIVIKMLIRD